MEKETKSYKTSYTFKACLGPKRHPIITHTRISIYEKKSRPVVRYTYDHPLLSHE